MASFFKDSTMWCESKNPHVQRACKIFANEEVKQVVCIIVLTFVIVKILDWLRYPVKKAFNWIMKNVYNCGNDHKCDEQSNEINAIYCSEHRDEDEEQHMIVCAIDLIINDDQEPMNSSIMTSDESMVISPNDTINESWTTSKNKSRTRRRGRKMGLSDICQIPFIKRTIFNLFYY